LSASLHIAVTVDPYIPVPPKFYGGIERAVDIVVRGLAARHHTITLFAHPESTVACKLIPYGNPPHFGLKPRVTELSQVGYRLWRHRNDFDVVLSWGRLAALLPVLPVNSLPKLQRYCRPSVPWNSIRIASRIAGQSIGFIGASGSVYRDGLRRGKGQWHTIYDCVELNKYTFVPSLPPDAPYVFLGRIERIKGTHDAIAIARRAGHRLVIAGNRVNSPEAEEYFNNEIAPHIDGDRVVYVGPVDDAQKNEILGRARTLLMPVDVEEAFGIVMAEAMACGTPVIGFARGSVPEVIVDGLTGFVCRDVDEALTAVGRLDEIDRAAVRADCEARFADTVVVEAYDRLCREMVATCRR
jgi:glycosyltransferase involved in cell wall biosynthesis